MKSTSILYYAAVAIGVLIAVGVVVAVVSALLSLLRLLVLAALLIGIVYAAYRLGSWLSSDDGGSVTAPSTPAERSGGRQDRLRRQYVDGEIDEATFERRIERELEAEDFDDVERELERER